MLSHQDLTSISLSLLHLALEAGREILEVYRSDNLQVKHKADLSPLTLADTRAHEVIDAGLARLVPEDPVVSEEGREVPFAERRAWTEFWLVDPLDGTKEFIKGNGEFTVNIGLVQDGVPTFGVIYAPVCGVAYLGLCPAPGQANAGPAEPSAAGARSADQAAAARTAPAAFPAPGAWRFMVDHDLTGAHIPDEKELGRRAEPIRGSRPEVPLRTGASSFEGAPGGAAGGVDTPGFSNTPRGGDARRGAGEISRITMIGSRSHIGRRTRAFMKRLGERFDDVRLLHIGSSLKLCMVAEGSANIYPRFWPTMEWDTAAGHALLRAAGGEIWQAPRNGHKPIPDWLADVPMDVVEGPRAPRAEDEDRGSPVDAGGAPHGPGGESRAPGKAGNLVALKYNKKSMRNGPFVARGW